MPPTARAGLPPRLLPILYFGAAHLALGTALGVVAVDPRGVAGFFYHPRMLGVVHLITLGWITPSILAFVNLVGAATMGVLIGFDKVYHFLPGFVLATSPAMRTSQQSAGHP